MSIKKFVNRVLTLADLKGFSEQELALVYAGQTQNPGKAFFSYYDSKYYDSRYYDSKYYDSKYYDTHYSERGGGYRGTDTDEGGRKYGDSSYRDSGGC
jgi:hypothetical protein